MNLQNALAFYTEDTAKTTVYGPCPGCDNWQLDIVEGAFPWPEPRLSYTEQSAVHLESFSGRMDTWLRAVAAARSAQIIELVEDAMREHADVCSGLRIILLERGL